MSHHLESQIEKIKASIAALEKQRSSLGDEVVEASINALHSHLQKLQNKPEVPKQQRKLATVLFTDIVASTRFSQQLDPEEVIDVIDSALKCLSKPVEKYGGHVTRFQGDGFKAVFGLPVAHENDPELAIRAGLDILEVSKEIGDQIENERGISGFQVRVGVNTGLVVAGGLTESEDTVMGKAVNLAARLESCAPPGGLLISHGTYQHVRGLFRVIPGDPIQAKGFPNPVPVYLVKGIAQTPSYFGSRGVEGIETPMVGRKAELQLLQEALNTSIEDGEGGVITILGEAGVGKSRLISEFENWIKSLPKDIRIFQGRSQYENQNQPYALIRDLFISQFKIEETDNVHVAQEKFEQGIFQAFSGSQASTALLTSPYAALVPSQGANVHLQAHVIGQLIGFDFSHDSFIEDLIQDPHDFLRWSRLAISEFFQALSQTTPVVIFLEDIHWADDRSLDLIAYLGEKTPEQAVMIVCLTRPDLYLRRPYWAEGHSYHQRIELRPLTKREAHHLVYEILQKVIKIPDTLRDLICQGAEGNPFYIEELIKMLIEAGVIVKSELQWQVDLARLGEMQVPPTLTSVLQARLDSLQDDEREVIQKASIIGRIFWDQVVRYMHISTHGNGEVEHIPKTLSSLREKEMIFRREVSSFSGAREYLFKHEILRDVTYESVLLKMRRKYHGLVADWLLRHALERKEEFTGSIAEHLELAGRDAEAVVYLHRAGQLAQQVFANEEAINFYQRCLAKIEPPIERSEFRKTFFEVNENMGDILNYSGKFPEARQYYSKVMPLLDSSNIIHKARLQRKIGDAWRNQGQYKEAQNAYQAAQSILAGSSDNDNAQWWQEWLEINLGYVGIYYWIDHADQMQHILEVIRPIVESHGTNRQQARYFTSYSMMLARSERYCISEQSLANYRLALELVESTGKPDFSMRFGRGFLLLWHGDLDESEDDLKTTLSFAEKTGDPTLQTRCLTYLTILYRFQGLPEKVSELASQTFSSAVDNKMPEYAFAARANQSWLAWREGNYREAELLAGEALEWLTQTKMKYSLKWLALFPLIDLALKKDQLDQAVEYARELLGIDQLRLPDILTSPLEGAVTTYDEGPPDICLPQLQKAIGLAEELGYL